MLPGLPASLLKEIRLAGAVASGENYGQDHRDCALLSRVLNGVQGILEVQECGVRRYHVTLWHEAAGRQAKLILASEAYEAMKQAAERLEA